MKFDYERIDIDSLSIADAIAALQAWEINHPDAVDATLEACSDGEYAFFEINYRRPYTPEELEFINSQAENAAKYQEEKDRKEYERLKAKYEGN